MGSDYYIIAFNGLFSLVIFITHPAPGWRSDISRFMIQKRSNQTKRRDES
jgi:hypothetical protein